MSVKVFGVVHGVNGKGNAYTVIQGSQPFDDYQKQHGAQGLKSVDAYILGSFDVPLDSNVDLVYAPGFNGKAQVVGVNVLTK